MLNKPIENKVIIIGAGLAGSECAYFLANKGIPVVLMEKKRIKLNPAQKSPLFAELVCTNSLKSKSLTTGHGLLKKEMEILGSLVLEAAKMAEVPAGEALAVDREKFSQYISDKIKSHQNITVIDEEGIDPLELKKRYKATYVVIATGPLTEKSLEDWIIKEWGQQDCYFYDAIAPVVDADSLNFDKLYFKNRHEEISEHADYLNAPMNKEEYERFIDALTQAEKVTPKDFEKEKFFESCLPIDVMAQRGKETARFSCMKPLGLSRGDQKPYAVVQMRKENLVGAAYNLVGFQTRLTYPEQKRVFRLIPGLENAEFIHYGSVHRNTFLNSAQVLNFDLSTKKYPEIYFAGQIIGVEGYTESASMGLYVGLQLWKKITDQNLHTFPLNLCIGALLNYVMTWERPSPSNINFGILPSVMLDKGIKYKDKKAARKELVVKSTLKGQEEFLLRYVNNNLSI